MGSRDADRGPGVAAGLTLRDIGEDRERALEAEAQARRVPLAEVVRGPIDGGRARARAGWIEAPGPGLADEARRPPAHLALPARSGQVGPARVACGPADRQIG